MVARLAHHTLSKLECGKDLYYRQYYTPYGELDIVAIRASLLWFVEVKGASQRASYDVVTTHKRQCLLKSIDYWLQHHDVNFEHMELVFCFRSSEGLDWIVDSCE